MRQAFKAEKSGDRSDLLNYDKLNAWTSAKLRDCFGEVEQEEPVEGQEGGHIVVLRVPPLSSVPV